MHQFWSIIIVVNIREINIKKKKTINLFQKKA